MKPVGAVLEQNRVFAVFAKGCICAASVSNILPLAQSAAAAAAAAAAAIAGGGGGGRGGGVVEGAH